MDSALLGYYTVPGPITDLGRYAAFVAWLTDDIRALYQVVQGLLIHDLWLIRYGIAGRQEQGYDTKIAFAADLWVCEYYRQDQGRWVLVDAQIDPFQQTLRTYRCRRRYWSVRGEP